MAVKLIFFESENCETKIMKRKKYFYEANVKNKNWMTPTQFLTSEFKMGNSSYFFEKII
jgi:hypothetical protein